MTSTGKQADETSVAIIDTKLGFIQRDISEIKVVLKELAGVYVTKQEFLDFKMQDFANVKRLVYGAVGIILTGFIVVIVSFFLRK